MTRAAAVLAFVLAALAPQEKPKSYRLPSTDLHQRVIWGASLEAPEGPSLAFGGEDQQADDGNPHTRVKVDGQWTAIHDELRKANPLQGAHEAAAGLARRTKNAVVRNRSAWLNGGTVWCGVAADPMSVKEFDTVFVGIDRASLPDYERDQAARAEQLLSSARRLVEPLDLKGGPDTIRAMETVQILVEIAAEMLDAEPAPRALSPIAWDAKTRCFAIFGGDHLDYLTNDLWTFDPAKRKWTQRHPDGTPPPRANHKLTADDGRLVVSGGYTYTSSTDYVGGQYRDLGDGDWTYSFAENAWSGSGKKGPENLRTYRSGRLHPDHYLGGAAPDRKAFGAWLDAVPANTWTLAKPPQLPALNRDWGTAVFDPLNRVILRWSGGHSAHGGTDVLIYHTETNRWNLTHPVEFPLGQLYSNTEYPEGVNFNRRPWVTGHTYQNYGVDPNTKKMLFTGRRDQCYVYDVFLGDWTRRFPKPKGMTYGDCFYTLTLTPTPEGLVCWTNQGQLFRHREDAWTEMPLKGKLPGSVVDNSTLVYDSKRERLLFFRKPYGDKATYDGVIQVAKEGEVSVLAPEGKDKAAGVPYLCQFRYDPATDLVLGGCTMEPDADGVRRTPAYDCAGNRWVTLKIGGDDPSGKKGRNVSLGLMVDVERKLFWAVDTNSNVYVLRLDVAAADLKPM